MRKKNTGLGIRRTGPSLSDATNYPCNHGLSSNLLWVLVPKSVKWDRNILKSLLVCSIKTSFFELGGRPDGLFQFKWTTLVAEVSLWGWLDWNTQSVHMVLKSPLWLESSVSNLCCSKRWSFGKVHLVTQFAIKIWHIYFDNVEKVFWETLMFNEL